MENDNPNEVTVTETGEGKFTQRIQIGTHTFLADEPENVGGNNKGPGPYDLLLAALGACTSMTIRMYATRKNIPLKGVRVTLTHQKVYNDDLINCVDKNARLDLIQRVIYLEGDLDSAQKEDLLSIADKCPVHKTLSQPSIIKTTLGTISNQGSYA